MEGMKSLSYKDRQEELALFILAKQRLSRDMIAVFKYVRETNTKKKDELFKLKYNAGTSTNGYKLALNKFRQEIRRRFLAIIVVKFWNSFPIRVMETQNVTAFKISISLQKGLYDVAGNCTQWLRKSFPDYVLMTKYTFCTYY